MTEMKKVLSSLKSALDNTNEYIRHTYHSGGDRFNKLLQVSEDGYILHRLFVPFKCLNDEQTELYPILEQYIGDQYSFVNPKYIDADRVDFMEMVVILDKTLSDVLNITTVGYSYDIDSGNLTKCPPLDFILRVNPLHIVTLQQIINGKAVKPDAYCTKSPVILTRMVNEQRLISTEQSYDIIQRLYTITGDHIDEYLSQQTKESETDDK